MASARLLAGAIDDTLRILNGAAGAPASFGGLHALLEVQHYRVAHWRAADEINYRRFFDISDLAALRVESSTVFDDTHRLVLGLLDEGALQGLRIDHVDGLSDPAAYCRRLRDRIGPGAFLVVEKILGAHEKLPPDWPIAGTTGYDALNQINGLFVAAAGERGLDRIYRRFTGRADSFDTLLLRAKAQILDDNLGSELQALAMAAKRIADADLAARDYTLAGLRRALIELIACFPVYRTYVTADGITEIDRRTIETAIARATAHGRAVDPGLYGFLGGLLTLTRWPAGQQDAVIDVVRRFQQLTGPAMAKGLEDTSFYRYTRLLSLNEVGGDREAEAPGVAAFHALNRERLAEVPHAVIATATHDTKRGEDVRARLNLLSEMPAAWARGVMRWARLNRLKRRTVDGQPAPTRNDEYLIYQTILGSWPLALKDTVTAGPALEAYVERLAAYLVKAMREAKERSSWSTPNALYEHAVERFVRAILEPAPANRFMADFLPFQRRIAELGMINGLAQSVVKLTIPGVPDIYQGSELWDLSLVDPDNRRPVDFASRQQSLAGDDTVEQLLARWPDGAIKQRILAILLRHRAAHRALYASGAYRPLAVTGERADHVLAFERRVDSDAVIVVVALQVADLVDDGDLPLGTTVWRDTAIAVDGTRHWRDLFSGVRFAPSGTLRVGDMLARLPVACLEPAG
jgi:(1->4)-alpha-D-glucan 1-alpha-D-glucosylmutase